MSDKEKVLIVEDDRDMVESMRVILESEGYEVQHAYFGADGLKLARDIKPDLIILDVMMESDTAGFHVAYEVRKDSDLQNTPILMITSIVKETGQSFSPESDGKYLPVDDFVEKPVQPARLLELVKNLLDLDTDEINVGKEE